MLSGKKKAQVLLSQLGDKATAILNLLSSESSSLLTSSVEDSPEADQEILTLLSQEVMEKLEIKNQNKSMTSLGKNGGMSSLENDMEKRMEKELDDIVEGEKDDDVQKKDDDNHRETQQDEVIDEDTNDQPMDDDGDINKEDKTNLEQIDKSEQPVLQKDSLSAHDMAEVLKLQKPQIIAFLLSKFDEDKREEVLVHLPEDIQLKVNELYIEKLPISDSVYDRLYESVFKQIKRQKQKELEEKEEEGKTEEKNDDEKMNEDVDSDDSLLQDDGSFDGTISFD